MKLFIFTTGISFPWPDFEPGYTLTNCRNLVGTDPDLLGGLAHETILLLGNWRYKRFLLPDALPTELRRSLSGAGGIRTRDCLVWSKYLISTPPIEIYMLRNWAKRENAPRSLAPCVGGASLGIRTLQWFSQNES